MTDLDRDEFIDAMIEVRNRVTAALDGCLLAINRGPTGISKAELRTNGVALGHAIARFLKVQKRIASRHD